MFFFLARWTLDAEVAVDLTAETFAVALRSWRTLRPLGPEQRRAWLFTVGRRLHARYVRRARVERRAVERLGIQIPSLHSDDLALIEERCGLGELRAALGVELGRLARRGTAHRQGPGGQLRRQDSRSAPPSWDDGPACVELRAGLPRRAAGTSRAEPSRRCRQTPARSGDPDVPVVACDTPVLLGQIGFPDRGHDRPVLTDRTALISPPAQAKRLQGSSRDPDRREEVTLPAADHDVAWDPVPAQAHRERLEQDRGHDDDARAPPASAGCPVFLASECSHI